mgnify:CR=1 FL=1
MVYSTMTYITYSQPKMKPNWDRRIKGLFNLVKTKSAPDLWIKVFFYKDNSTVYEQEVFRNERNNFYHSDELIKTETDDEMNDRISKAIWQIKFYFGDRFKPEDVKRINTSHNWIKCNGHYRYAEVFGHSFYDEEWKFIRKHPKVKHVITLKIDERCSDYSIAELIAHEFRHYLQFKKYGGSMTRRGNNGRRNRPVQVERDAKKWAKKRIDTLVAKGKLFK